MHNTIKVSVFCVFFLLGFASRSGAQVHRSFLQYMPPTMDPVEATETNSQFVITNSFDGLVAWDPEVGLSPQLAMSWSFSPDRKRVTFTLRTASFSDGTPLTEQSVVNHFDRLRKSSYFKEHFFLISNVKAIGKMTVEFTLRTPSPHFLHLLAGTHSKIVKKTENGTIIGIGPFIPTFGKNEVLLNKNEKYWGVSPKVDKIELKVFEMDELLQAAKDGRVDDMILNPSSAELSDEINGGRWLSEKMWATWAIAMDRRSQHLDSAEIRKQILMSLTSNEFLKIFPGNLEAFGIQSFGMPGYLENSQKLPGLQKLAATKHTQKAHTKINIDIHLPKELPKLIDVEKWIENKKLDCCVLHPVKTPFIKIIEQVGKGGFGAYLISFNPEYPDPSFLVRALSSKSKSNYLGLKNKKIDELIAQISLTDDTLERARLSTLINQVIMSEFSLVPLMHVVHRAWIRNCASGISLSPVSEGYFSLRGVENKCR